MNDQPVGEGTPSGDTATDEVATRRRTAPQEGQTTNEGVTSASATPEGGASEEKPPTARRRSRGGRGRGGRGRSASTTAPEPAEAGAAEDGSDRGSTRTAGTRTGGGASRARSRSGSARGGEADAAGPGKGEPASDEDGGDRPTGTRSAARRRRRGGRGRGSGAETPPTDAGAAGETRAAAESTDRTDQDVAGSQDEPGGQGVTSASQRRRRRRRRSRSGSTTATATSSEAADQQPGDGQPKADRSTAAAADGTGTRRRRAASTSAGTKAAKPATAAKPAKAARPAKPEAPAAPEGDGAGARPARRSRRSRAKEGDGTAGPTRTTRTRGTRASARRRREEYIPVVQRSQDKVMLITERDDRDQIAVMEDRVLVEHYITRAGAHAMVGNIYLGKVQNVLPGMEAAFIDVGKGRNAVLYAGEVNYDEADLEGGDRRIERALKPAQAVLVQVTKDPIGGKGPRLTAQVSLPGRYVVLVPNSQVFGISRRLPEDERKRLRTIVKKVKPDHHGVIVRTAADQASEENLMADVSRLVRTWAEIERTSKRGKAPRLIYEEPELTVRVVRDLFTGGEFKEVVTDSESVRDRVSAYLKEVAPDLVEKVRLHTGALPLFEQHHASEQIHKALDRKVWLPSGGYVIIERVEAMTVIDVNTGKHVGKTNLEETVFKTNIEAAEEIARQLRLRDIGGIIIIDFIDMLLERNKDRVVDALRDAMAQDKTRSQVFDITPLGLLEVTRKRVSAGLLESFSEPCPTCEGRGILLTHQI